jgi:hypothetical protein
MPFDWPPWAKGVHSNFTVKAMMAIQQIELRRGHVRLSVVLALGIVVLYSGCTTIKDTARSTARTVSDTSRKVTGAFTSAGSDIRYRIALLGVENQPAANSSFFPGVFQKTLAANLKSDCPDCIVDATVGEILKSPPRLASGPIDGYALALIGRPRGLNYFVVGTLSDSRLTDEKTGFWLWKDTRYKIRVVLRVEVIDSATGTKALDETLSGEAVIDELRHEEILERDPLPFAEIEPILNQLLPEAGYRICAAIRLQPWQGFIVGAEDRRITISSGSGVGLSPGRMLAVYGGGRVVDSNDGRRFVRPGERLGEARISSVSADQAEAVLSQPIQAGPGGTVRLK